MSEQAVVEDSNTTSEEVVSDDNALDDLLNEYDEGTTKEVETGEQTDLKEVVSYIKQDRENKELEASTAAINDAVKVVKGDSDLPDIVFEGMLHAKARDPRFLQAFTNRAANPAGWTKVLNAVAKEFNDSMPKEDAGLSATTEAIASAVQSASTKQPTEETTDWSSLSDSDFNRKKAELIRKG